jgi:hypothetical protein
MRYCSLPTFSSEHGDKNRDKEEVPRYEQTYVAECRSKPITYLPHIFHESGPFLQIKIRLHRRGQGDQVKPNNQNARIEHSTRRQLDCIIQEIPETLPNEQVHYQRGGQRQDEQYCETIDILNHWPIPPFLFLLSGDLPQKDSKKITMPKPP